MTALDPKKLFGRLAQDIPKPLQKYVFIVGSLAAAYHFRAELERRAVNTKDADVMVHPAGEVKSAKALAGKLLNLAWRRTPECHAAPSRSPADTLRAIRLYPPASNDYFIELLGLPRRDQAKPVIWRPVRLDDGWYGIGCHRFMSLTAFGRLQSKEGLEYASPAMMALANLLSHPTVGTQRMSHPIAGRKILRSAKDLGRVLALAWLTGREGTEAWARDWILALRTYFPKNGRSLARRAGSGLRELIKTPDALEEARVTTEVGLLNGRNISTENLVAITRQLELDVLRPFSTGTV